MQQPRVIPGVIPSPNKIDHSRPVSWGLFATFSWSTSFPPGHLTGGFEGWVDGLMIASPSGASQQQRNTQEWNFNKNRNADSAGLNDSRQIEHPNITHEPQSKTMAQAMQLLATGDNSKRFTYRDRDIPEDRENRVLPLYCRRNLRRDPPYPRSDRTPCSNSQTGPARRRCQRSTADLSEKDRCATTRS